VRAGKRGEKKRKEEKGLSLKVRPRKPLQEPQEREWPLGEGNPVETTTQGRVVSKSGGERRVG